MNENYKEKLVRKIDAYKDTLDDLGIKLQELEQGKVRLMQNMSDIRGYLQAYKTELSSIGKSKEKGTYRFTRKSLIDTSEMTTPEAIMAILKQSGNPMHVKEITETVLSGGKKINSKKPQNVIYATIAKRKKLFIKVGPNIYDLVKESKLF